jgi:hypothetical protein
MSNATPDPTPNNDPKGEHPWVKILLAIIAVIGLAVPAYITGLFGLMKPNPIAPNQPTTTTSTSSCTSFLADVSIPHTITGPYFTATFTVHCAPEQGKHHLAIIEQVNIGNDHHSNYYPKDLLPQQAANPFSFRVPEYNMQSGTRICLYMLDPTYSQLEQIMSNLTPESYTTALPDGLQPTSPPSCTVHE